MGVAFYIVTEKEMPQDDIYVGGKALAHCDDLDELAKNAGVRPLMEFFSCSREDAESTLDDFRAITDDLANLTGHREDAESMLSDLEDIDLEGFPDVNWFEAKEGLLTVRGLISYLNTNPKAVKKTDAVIDDLQQFESVLTKLDNAGVRWHLAVDV
jgi:hypothetical protein